MKEVTSKGICEKLESFYMTNSVTNQLLLKSRLYDLYLEEGKPLKTHLYEFYSVVMDLQNINVKLDDEDLAIYLLCPCHHLTSTVERPCFMILMI